MEMNLVCLDAHKVNTILINWKTYISHGCDVGRYFQVTLTPSCLDGINDEILFSIK